MTYKVENVSDFWVTDERHMVTLHGKLTSRDINLWSSGQEAVSLLSNALISTCRLDSNALWAYSKGKTFEWDIKSVGTNPVALQYDNISPVKNTSNGILANKTVEGSVSLGVIEDASKGLFKWLKDYSSTMLLSSHKFICLVYFNEALEKKEIKCLELASGTEVWRYVLTNSYDWVDEFGEKHPGEVYKLIAIHNEVLWSVLTNGLILGIDMQSGEVVHQVFNANSYVNYEREMDSGATVNILNRYSYFDSEAESIFGAQGKYYWELHLKPPYNQFTSWAIHGLNDNIELNNIAGWNSDQIFFYEGGESNKYGILDRNEKKVIAIYDMQEVAGKFPAIRKMVYAARRLYILDCNHTLHIKEV